MPIVYKRNRAVFTEGAAAEEAETLLEWLHKHPKGKIDLAACTHLHPANLQVLMAAKRTVEVPPSDGDLATWVASALKTS